MISLQRLFFLLSSSRIIISIAAKNYVPTAEDLPYTVAGLDLKCPYKHGDRIKKKSDSSRQECYNLCKDHPECIAFTFSEDVDECMLCKTASALESGMGYITYKLKNKLDFELSKCPYDNTRIFKESKKSFDECKERCYNQPTCEYFSHDESAGECLGCSSNALPLATEGANGFKTFKLKELKDFPYKLTDLDTKCPSTGRLLKTSTETREDCYKLCNDTSGCGYFTYGEGDNLRPRDKKSCMLCEKSASLDTFPGFITYEIISTKHAGEHVWGVNTNDSIYYRAGHSAGKWIKLGGMLTDISVSDDGEHVWGVNKNDEIYYRAGFSAEKWTKVPGSLVQISVSGDGNHVWGVNKHDHIYHRAGFSAEKWTQVSGSLVDVAVSGDGNHVWGVNKHDHIYYRAGFSAEKWTQVSGSLVDISVSGDGNHVWGVNKNDDIYYRAGFSAEKWTQVSGSLVNISVGGDGNHVWGVNKNDHIYYRAGFSAEKWTLVSGKLVDISVGA